METKVCKVCGRELPETDFPMGRYGYQRARRKNKFDWRFKDE